DDQTSAPPAGTPPDPLRRSSPRWLGEPCPTSASRRVQEKGDPAKVARQRPAVLGRAIKTVGPVEAGSGHRVAGHRPAVAAASLPGILDQALRSARRGPATRGRRTPCLG